LLDPCTGHSPTGALSATVIAPTCAAADALATAAYVLGPAHGIDLLEREAAQGLIVTRQGIRRTRDLRKVADAA
jgi:thiamine biosynthesis lipoprotein